MSIHPYLSKKSIVNITNDVPQYQKKIFLNIKIIFPNINNNDNLEGYMNMFL